MTDATQPQERKRSGSAWMWIILILLLAALAGAAFWWFVLRKDDGSFSLRFTACDTQERCGTFKLFAPGYRYAWAFDKARLEFIDGDIPDLLPVVEKDMKRAKGVIAAGLASSEGDGDTNKRLSACRSHNLASLLDDVQATLDTDAKTYRVSMGRYTGETPGVDTSIQRLVVLAYILKEDPGLNLDEALRSGLSRQLPSALKAFASEAVRQLDFTQYDCWATEFQVTERDVRRRACFREPSRDPGRYCSEF